MFGRKTLVEIRRDISRRLKADGIDEAELLKELGHLQKPPKKDKAAIQSLVKLAETLKPAKERKRRQTVAKAEQ
jgi:hypothetical protein